MKIVSIGPAYPLRGGIANFNESFCIAAQKKGIETTIISYKLQYPSLFFPGKTQKDESATKPEDIEIYTLINSINPFNWINVALKINKMNPDVLFINYWMPFFSPALGTIIRISRMFRKFKTVALVHNVVPHETHLGWRILSHYLIQACDGFIALSKAVIYDLSEFTSTTKKLFLPHPLYELFGERVDRDLSIDHFKFDRKNKHLLFFGLIRKYKGLELMIEAIDKIKTPNVKLVVAGEFYENKEYYFERIKELGIEDKIIIFDKYVPKEEVKFLFSLADLVVQPYLTATQSGVTQIAYQFECPMLVTNVGGLSEIVPHGKVGYVVAKDPWKIASAIDDFFEGEKAELFIKNIKIEKQRFTWDRFVNSALEFIESDMEYIVSKDD